MPLQRISFWYMNKWVDDCSTSNGKSIVSATGSTFVHALPPTVTLFSLPANACGARVRSLPITVDKVIAALEKGAKK